MAALSRWLSGEAAFRWVTAAAVVALVAAVFVFAPPQPRPALVVGTVVGVNHGEAMLSVGSGSASPCGTSPDPHVCAFQAKATVLAAHRVKVDLRRATWDTAFGTPLKAAPRLVVGETLAAQGEIERTKHPAPDLDARMAVVLAAGPLWHPWPPCGWAGTTAGCPRSPCVQVPQPQARTAAATSAALLVCGHPLP